MDLKNMYQWIEDQKAIPQKKPLPVLSFPSIQLLDITVKELISDSEIQARGMKAVADRTPGAGGNALARKYASPRMKFLPLSGR